MAIKYDNCKDCHSRCIHAGKDRDFICMNGVSCKITTENPQTNADRIRAMSDEELAEWLTEFANEAFAAGAIGFGGALMTDHDRLTWLQQPEE